MKEIRDTLDKIFEKLDAVDDKQEKMAILQAEHTAHLAEHMRRTELLEQRIEKDLPPVKRHVDQVKGGLKLLAIIVPIVVTLWLALR